MYSNMMSVILVFMNCLLLSSAFNVDIPSFVMHSSPREGSMFGFSVAIYSYRNSSSLLIGAPTYQTNQPGVTNGGAVLHCDSGYAGTCNYVPFDVSAKQLKTDKRNRISGDVQILGLNTDSKSNQFFGSTVKASKQNDVVVACAPRYVWFSTSQNKRDPVGTCFVATQGLTAFEEFSPCRNEFWGYHRQGFCQAGFDAAITQNGERLYVGAPGAYYWQGEGYGTILKGQIHSQELGGRHRYYGTGESPAEDDDQYLGYSVASGDFNGDGVEDVALGVPKGLNYTGKDQAGTGNATGMHYKPARGYIFNESTQHGYTRTEYNAFFQDPLDELAYAGYALTTGEMDDRYDGEELVISIPRALNSDGILTGKIAIYSQDLREIQNITGDQLGSYFGYCLAVVDFNGDGKDDIIVGSPMYTDYEDREMKIEVGRVHILMQLNRRFEANVILTGEVHRARLGLSLTSLGDINLDGYGDIAVGAPYGGEDGRGAVFIYNGFDTSPGYDEALLKPAQVLYASEVGSGVTTFGWALSGGVDTDNNRYPDLLVGAYEADKAFLFRSRPIINFYDFKVEFMSQGKTIDIESKNCDLPRGSGFTCVDLEFCMAYNGVNVDDQIDLDLTYKLDTLSASDVRLLFQSNEERTFTERVRYSKEVRKCRTLKTFVVPGLTDKLTPIKAEVAYELVQQRRSPRSLTPVLNLGQQLSASDSMSIMNNCGPDNICIPDLSLTFDAPDEFVIGKKEMMTVDVKVINKGEDAFEAVVYITEPPGLLYNKFIQSENSTLTLSTTKINGSMFIKIDIGNPLPKNQEVEFSVMFQQSQDVLHANYEFLVSANSTNAEISGTNDDNVIRKVVKAVIDAKLTLFGTSDPELLIYNVSQYQVPFRSHENHIGPSLIHKYGLLNKGPSETDEIDIVVMWPSRTLDGKHLLYLMEQPITIGNVECEEVPDINPLQYTSLGRASRAKLLGLSSLEAISSSSSGYSSQTGYSSSSSYSGSEAGTGSTGRFSSGGTGDNQYSFSETSGSSVGSGSGSSYSSSSGSKEYSQSGSSSFSRFPSSSGSSSKTAEESHSKNIHTSYSAGSTSSGGSGSYDSADRTQYVSSSSSGHGASSGRQQGFQSSTEQRLGSSSGRNQYTGQRGFSSSSQSGYSGQGGYSSTNPSEEEISSRQYGYESSIHSAQGRPDVSSSRNNYHSSQDGYGSSSNQQGYSSSGQRYGSSQNAYGTSSGYDTSRQGYISPTQRIDNSEPGQIDQGYGSTTDSQYSSSGQRRYGTQYSQGSSTQGGYGSRVGYTGQGYQGQASESEHSSSRANSAQSGYSGSSGNQGSGGHQSGFFAGPNRYGAARTYTFTNPGIPSGSSNQENAYSRSSSRDYTSSSDGYGSGGDGSRSETYSWSTNKEISGGSDGYTETSETAYTGNDGVTHRTSSSRKYDSPPNNQLSQSYGAHRTKRDVIQDEWYSLTSDCGATECTRIQCKVKKLKENEDVYIYLRSRLYIKTITEYKFPVDDVFMSTRMVTRARISAQGVSEDIVKVDKKDIRTQIKSAKSLEEAPAVPWWVWLLAILAGILILVILILILYKCGYFKRHRPEHTATLNEDAQPLHSNGNGRSNGHGSHRP